VDKQQQDGQQQQSGGGLWTAVIFWVALVFLLIVLGGYVQEWKWTGLAVDPNRTLWDWLDFLIVPAVLAVGGYLFTRSERTREPCGARNSSVPWTGRSPPNRPRPIVR
jgi:hypothetical protein